MANEIYCSYEYISPLFSFQPNSSGLTEQMIISHDEGDHEPVKLKCRINEENNDDDENDDENDDEDDDEDEDEDDDEDDDEDEDEIIRRRKEDMKVSPQVDNNVGALIEKRK
jgi:hypothetical protein